MSAFMVEDIHIQVLVGAALEFDGNMAYYDKAQPQGMDYAEWNEWHKEHQKEANLGTANDTGQMLYDANLASIEARYGDRWPQEPRKPFAYKASFITMLDPVKMLGAIRCFDYQACEVSNYDLTEAAQYTKALAEVCVSRVRRDDNTWSVDELDDVRLDEFKGREIRSLTQLIERRTYRKEE